MSSVVGSLSQPSARALQPTIAEIVQTRDLSALENCLQNRKWPEATIGSLRYVTQLVFGMLSLPGARQDMDPIYFRLYWESLKVRDWTVFSSLPPFSDQNSFFFIYKTLQILLEELVQPSNETIVFKMFVCFARQYRYSQVKFAVEHLLDEAVRTSDVDRVQKLLEAFPRITKELRIFLTEAFIIYCRTVSAQKYKIIQLLDPAFYSFLLKRAENRTEIAALMRAEEVRGT